MVPGLLPQLLGIVQQRGQYEDTVVKRAVAILRQCVHICMDAEGPYKVQARQVLLPYLEPWLQQFCAIMTTFATSRVREHSASLSSCIVAGSLHLMNSYGSIVCKCSALTRRVVGGL